MVTGGKLKIFNPQYLSAKGTAEVHVEDAEYLTVGESTYVKAYYNSVYSIVNVWNLQNKLEIYANDLKEGDIIARGANTIPTTSDLEKISVFANGYTWEQNGQLYIENDGEGCYQISVPIYLKDNIIYAGKRDDGTISTEDDLQKRLNEIAERGVATYWQPDTVRISSKGISVSNIYTKENCHAVITGGPITVQNVAHCNFSVEKNSSLNFKDITFNMSEKKSDHIFYVWDGCDVKIDEGVEFINFRTEDNGAMLCHFEGGGNFAMYSGIFTSKQTVVGGFNGGVFNMYGGELESQNYATVNCNSVYLSGSGIIRGYGDVVVKANKFEISQNGIIAAEKSNATYVEAENLTLDGGTFIGNGSKNVIRKEAIVDNVLYSNSLPKFYLEKDAYVEILSKPNNSLCFDANWGEFKLDNPFVYGRKKHSVLPNGGTGYYGYDLTEEDFNNMDFLNMPENLQPYFSLECPNPDVVYLYPTQGFVSLREVSNEISSEDDLQKRLNEIADRGVATEELPDTIKINEKGISINRIIVPKNCYAVITGGTIKLNDASHEYFDVMGYVSFKDIEFDFSNADAYYLFEAYGGGKIFIDYGVEFKNLKSDNKMGLCYLYEGGSSFIYNSGYFKSDNTIIAGNSCGGEIIFDGKGIIESSTTAIDVKNTKIKLAHGKIIGHGDIVVNTDGEFNGMNLKIDIYLPDLYISPEINSIKNGSIYVSSTIGSYGGSISFTGNGTKNRILQYGDIIPNERFPIFELGDDARIRLTGTPEGGYYVTSRPLTFDADWAKFALNEPIISGTNFDGDSITFLNMPENIKPHFVKIIGFPSRGWYELRKIAMSDDDLQDELDRLIGETQNGDKDKDQEYEIPISPDGFDQDDDIEYDDLQIFLDGEKEDGSNTDYNFKGGQFRIKERASLRVDHLDFHCTHEGSHFYVSGKMTIEEYVRIYNFKRFIHLCNGGHIIWKSRYETEATSEVIYNEGGQVRIVYGTFPGGIRNGGELYFGGDGFTGNIYHKKGGVIYITKLLECITRQIDIHIYIDITEIENYFTLICGGEGYKLSKEDLKYIHIHLPEGYEWYYDEYDFTVRIRKQVSESEDFYSWMEVFYNENRWGTEDEPEDVHVCGCGVSIVKNVTIKEYLNLIINGQKEDNTYVDFKFDGGMFDIPYSTYLRIINLNIYGNNGDSYFRVGGKLYVDENISISLFRRFIHILYGGHVIWNNIIDMSASSEVIYNEGRLDILTGTFTGTGGIRNAGKIYFGGDDFTGNIYHKKGGIVYITRLIQRITRNIHIHIYFTKEEIEDSKTVIVGCNGYTLTEKDMENITIHLPEGYEWQLEDGCVKISLSTGIEDVMNDAPAGEYYNINGMKTPTPNKGFNIMRMNDGTVKKVIVK